MITKQDIIKFARHVTRRSKGLPDRRLMHPYREWYIGLAVAGVLVCAGIAYTYSQYQYYDTIEERVAGDVGEVIEYRSNVAERVTVRFVARSAVFDRLRAGATVAAPALRGIPGQESDTGAAADGIRLVP